MATNINTDSNMISMITSLKSMEKSISKMQQSVDNISKSPSITEPIRLTDRGGSSSSARNSSDNTNNNSNNTFGNTGFSSRDQQQFLDGIEDIRNDLQGTPRTFDQLSKHINFQETIQKGLQGAVNGMHKMTDVALKGITKIASGIQSGLSKFAALTEKAFSKLTSVVTGIATSVTALATTGITMITQLLTKFITRANNDIDKMFEARNDIMYEYGLSDPHQADEIYKRQFSHQARPYQQFTAPELREKSRMNQTSLIDAGFNTQTLLQNGTKELNKWDDVFSNINLAASDLFKETMEFVDSSGNSIDALLGSIESASTRYLVTPELLEKVASGYTKYLRTITSNSREFTSSMSNMIEVTGKLENMGVDSSQYIGDVQNFMYSDLAGASSTQTWTRMSQLGMNPYEELTTKSQDQVLDAYTKSLQKYFSEYDITKSYDRAQINTLAQSVLGFSPSDMPNLYALLKEDKSKKGKKGKTDVGYIKDYVQKISIDMDRWVDKETSKWTYVTEKQKAQDKITLGILNSPLVAAREQFDQSTKGLIDPDALSGAIIKALSTVLVGLVGLPLVAGLSLKKLGSMLLSGGALTSALAAVGRLPGTITQALGKGISKVTSGAAGLGSKLGKGVVSAGESAYIRGLYAKDALKSGASKLGKGAVSLGESAYIRGLYAKDALKKGASRLGATRLGASKLGRGVASLGKGIGKAVGGVANVTSKAGGVLVKGAGALGKGAKVAAKGVFKGITGAAKGITKAGGKILASPFAAGVIDGVMALGSGKGKQWYGKDANTNKGRVSTFLTGAIAGTGPSITDKNASAGEKALSVGMGAAKGAAIGSILPGIGTAVGAVVGGILAAIGPDKISKVVKKAVDKISELFMKLPEMAGNIVNKFSEWVDGGEADNLLNNIVGSIQNFFTNDLPPIINKLASKLGEFARTGLPKLGKTLGKIAFKIVKQIPKLLDALWNLIKKTAPTLLKAAWDLTCGLFGMVWEVLKSLPGVLWEGLKGLWNWAVKQVQKVTDPIAEGLIDFVDLLKYSWYSLKEMIWSGIGAVVDSALDLLPDSVRSLIGLEGDSRFTQWAKEAEKDKDDVWASYTGRKKETERERKEDEYLTNYKNNTNVKKSLDEAKKNNKSRKKQTEAIKSNSTELLKLKNTSKVNTKSLDKNTKISNNLTEKVKAVPHEIKSKVTDPAANKIKGTADSLSKSFKDLVKPLTDKIKSVIDKITSHSKIASNLYKLLSDLASSVSLGEGGGGPVSTGDFYNPFSKYPITSGYGYRKAPTSGASTFHHAIDLGIPEGTPLPALDGGTVLSSKMAGGYGNQVSWLGDNGYTFYYSHMSKRNVKKGDRIERGDIIGNCGSTGYATGPHLDLMIEDGTGSKKWLDPKKDYFDKKIKSGSKANAVSVKQKNLKFPTYNLTQREIEGIANIVRLEQGSDAARRAEASLIANLAERDGVDPVTKVKSGWFASGASRFAAGTKDKSVINIVKDVLVKGYRTLPRYVDEHDFVGDLIPHNANQNGYVSNSGKRFDPHDRSKFIPHVTKMHNNMGSTYTFYSFPAPGSDPFGYTSKAARKKYGDGHYDAHKSYSGSSGSSSSSGGGSLFSKIFDLFFGGGSTSVASGSVSKSASKIIKKNTDASRWKQVTGGKSSSGQGISESTASKLQTRMSIGGKSMTTNKYLVPVWSSLLKELTSQGFKIAQLASYCYRAKRGGSGLSSHAYGAAIDLNWDTKGMRWHDIPPTGNSKNKKVIGRHSKLAKIIGKYKLDWGGSWSSGYVDPMHISYVGDNSTGYTLSHVSAYETGGVISKPTLSLMGEGGHTEYVISTDPKYATRSQSLLAQAASDLAKNSQITATSRGASLPTVSLDIDRIVSSIETVGRIVQQGFASLNRNKNSEDKKVQEQKASSKLITDYA